MSISLGARSNSRSRGRISRAASHAAGAGSCTVAYRTVHTSLATYHHYRTAPTTTTIKSQLPTLTAIWCRILKEDAEDLPVPGKADE